MRTSTDHILTSHVGSLPRPDELIAANRARETGEALDEGAFQATLSAAVMEAVRHQQALGIDVPGDGEFGKAMGQRVNYGSWWRYSWQRLAGIEAGAQTLYEMAPQRSRPGEIVLTSFGDRRDRTFPDAAGRPERRREDAHQHAQRHDLRRRRHERCHGGRGALVDVGRPLVERRGRGLEGEAAEDHGDAEQPPSRLR